MNDYWRKACEAASEARILLAAEKCDGVASRADYAMYDAARAALETVDSELAKAKTHATIISRFGSHVVVPHQLDPAIGRILNGAEDLRIAADYDRHSIAPEDAAEIIDRMEQFLTAVASFLGEAPP